MWQVTSLINCLCNQELWTRLYYLPSPFCPYFQGSLIIIPAFLLLNVCHPLIFAEVKMVRSVPALIYLLKVSHFIIHTENSQRVSLVTPFQACCLVSRHTGWVYGKQYWKRVPVSNWGFLNRSEFQKCFHTMKCSKQIFPSYQFESRKKKRIM